ncbi:MAG TPA: hypothetical protein VHI11_12995 [Jiangellaceae bacterium]|jgi:hypothetical protein|nr:hypothetical protein [Jiangellaceae bacterium]
MPQGGEYDVDDWGNLATLMTALTADQMRQLSAERDSGYPPW